MAITKVKKQEVTEKIADSVKDAASVVFVHFKGLTVGDTSAMRKSLREGGVGYYVAKKTLIRRALADKGYEGTMPELQARSRSHGATRTRPRLLATCSNTARSTRERSPSWAASSTGSSRTQLA